MTSPLPQAPSTSVDPLVFISYARRTSAQQADALRRKLEALAVPVFLDTLQAASGEGIPEKVLEALLSAHVVVVFVEKEYFTRRYCEEEWTIAVLAYRALLRRGASPAECANALDPIVVARPSGGELPAEWERLPPALKVGDWPLASESQGLADLVRSRLEQIRVSIGERLSTLSELSGLRERVSELMAIPEPKSLSGLPVYHETGLPPSIGDAFVGRASELWEVHSHLSSSRVGARTAAVTTALDGGGGFGKTRLALEYVHRYGPSDYPGGIFWVNAEVSEDRLEAQMHGMLRLLRPTDTPGLDAFRASRRNAASELGEALRDLGEHALYVIDNVPETSGRGHPEQLSHWCPAAGGVTLLVTSRAHQSVITGVRRLELRELSTSSAVRLLTHDVPGRGELDAAQWGSIAMWVGEWPLALELLNAALREGAITARELLALSEGGDPVSQLDRQMEAVAGAVPEGTLRGATEAIAASYQRLPPEGRYAARLLGWLAPDPIPAALVTALGDKVMPPRVRVLLRARSLVSGVSGTDVEMYGRVHRVLGDYLRGISDDPIAELCTVCDVLTTRLDYDASREPAQWQLMDACRPHAEAAFRRAAALPPHTKLAEAGVSLALHVGQLLHEQGELEGAADRQRAAVELATRVLGESHPTQLRAMADLARVVRLQGNLASAHRLHEHVLKARRKILGKDHDDTLQAMRALAETLHIMGHRRRARELLEQALELRRRLFGAEHPETLRLMSALADAFRAQGAMSAAQQLQEDVVELRRQVSGAEHLETLGAMASLAITLGLQGDLQRARQLHEEVLQVRLRLLGDEHHVTVHAMAHLAATVRMRGEAENARRLEEAVLAWRRQNLGEEHPETLLAMAHLTETLLAQGELQRAAGLAKEAVDRWQRIFGATHPDTLWAMGHLAETWRAIGDLQRADVLLEQILEGRLRVLGPEHPDTLWTVTTLADVKRGLGDIAAADALAMKAAVIRQHRDE
jgi:tetratricopeptide (TPR) repeat protein